MNSPNQLDTGELYAELPAPPPAPRRVWLALAVLLLIFVAAELYPAMYKLSPAQDEPSHVRSGLTMLTGSRYVNPAQAWWTQLDVLHPPSDMLFGLAALAVGDSPELRTHVHPSFRAIRAARCVAIALGAGILLLAFAWVRAIWGDAAGLIAVAAIALQPLFFAHAGFVSSDLTMVFGGLVAAWVLWRRWLVATSWLEQSRWRVARVALELGLVLWLAALCKVSNLYFIAVQCALAALAIWHVRRDIDARHLAWRAALAVAGSSAFCLLASAAVWDAISPHRPAVTIWGHPVQLHFGQALLFSAHTATSIQDAIPYPVYFGHLRPPSWKFYALATLLKTPFPLLIAWALLPVLLWRRWGALARRQQVWALYVILLGGGMALLFATRGAYLGLRHLLLPLVLGGAAAGMFAALALRARGSRWRALLVVLAALLLACQHSYPWQLSFFNFSPLLHERLPLVDTDSDWGQGLLALRDWQRAHPGETLWLASFANARPEDYGIKYRGLLAPYSFEPLDPEHELGRDPAKITGYVAISATHLAGSVMYVARQPDDYYAAWRAEKPVALLGGSIYLFRGHGAPH